MRSANRFDGSTKARCIGLTVVLYCSRTCANLRPRCSMSRSQPAHQPDVGVGVDEKLQVHLPAEALFCEHQDPLDDHHRGGFDPPGFGAAHVLPEVILRDLGGADRRVSPRGARPSSSVSMASGWS